jgi:UDP-N-acetylglucosamine--N-acetylmuramyl-(pentapeptide) pyrophosphoryl-undecaprenol N-acetylglucosamine transferase
VSRPIVIAGGGTGGHVFVAGAVAEALERDGLERSELRFVGSTRGQEAELLASSGVELVLLPGRGIRRSMALSAWRANLGALIGIGRAFVQGLGLLGRWRPAAVVSVGGYAAAPVGLAAVLRRCPLILVNTDAVPGLAHRVLSPFAAASCVAVPGVALRHPVVTGIPVRATFADLDRSSAARRAARAALGCDPERPFVAVVTGSLGARSVNRAVLELATRWSGFSGTIYHVTGRRDAAEIEASRPLPVEGGLDYRVVPFEDRMALLYQAADLAITRAGALTVGELAVCGVAGLLVPLPGAPGDHQTKNAQSLVERGAALLVPDAELSAERLEELCSALLGDPARLAEMERSARRLAHPRAADEIAQVVLSHAG